MLLLIEGFSMYVDGLLSLDSYKILPSSLKDMANKVRCWKEFGSYFVGSFSSKYMSILSKIIVILAYVP